ncbi:FtsX-like permease family protein [Phaeacidiphilus oryzae]|uniref:FtsX-like permease family protein n=1 Tax=Phaeacidiphilus oryzae TaxID=348818 RepID=UPI0005608A78|nr:FtsX-like permease family protein [Phaeacidiphilus oryzae]
MRPAAWRAALRIARRDALRSRGRSALVAVMIALPVLGASAADVTARSSHLSAATVATRQMGAADALVSISDPGHPIEQQPNPGDGSEESGRLTAMAPYTPSAAARSAAAASPERLLKAALPAGSRLTPLPEETTGIPFTTRYGVTSPGYRELDLRSPATRGLVTMRQGSWPDRPYEIAATTAFLKSAGLRVGDTTTPLGTDRPYRITAAVEYPGLLADRALIARPGELYSVLARSTSVMADVEGSARPTGDGSWLVRLPSGSGGFSWPQVLRANGYGVEVTSRAVLLDPPAADRIPYHLDFHDRASRGGGISSTAAIALSTAVAMALLEVVLLAGPAFAVGARRNRRQLGLVAVAGGDRRHIRAVVLAGGAVLGGAGALVGLGLGIVAAAVLRGPLEQYSGSRFGGLTLAPLDLAALVVLGVLTGLAAALVPAVQASRQSVTAALGQRGSVRAPSRALLVCGLAVVLLGAAGAVFGAATGHGSTAVGAGSVLAELGLVACTPHLVLLAGRVAGRLPLGPRLALRDAARNRGRTAPAVAAVTAAVAGAVAILTYQAGQDAAQRAEYRAGAPAGALVLQLGEAPDPQGRAAAAERAATAAVLPGLGSRADVYRTYYGADCAVSAKGSDADTRRCGSVQLRMPADRLCRDTTPKAALDPYGSGAEISATEARRLLRTDPRCRAAEVNSMYFGDVVAGDADVLRNLLGVDDAAAERRLAQGAVLVTDPRYVEDGRVTLLRTLDPVGEDQKPETSTVSLPAVVVDAKVPSAQAVLSVRAARAAGVGTSPAGSIWLPGAGPEAGGAGGVTSAQLQAATAAVAKQGGSGSLTVESGYRSDSGVVALMLLIIASAVAVAAAGVATGLSAADSQRDLDTLSAVGAAPRIRRTLSGFQCAAVAAIGVLLGTLAGVVPAAGLVKADQAAERPWVDAVTGDISLAAHPLVVPWPELGALLLGLPALAWVLAAALTRSNRLTRRMSV